MKRPRFNFAQRVVMVVGLAIFFYFFGSWVTNLVSSPLTGWTGYAPLQSNSFFVRLGGLHAGVRLVLWLILTIVWTALSLWLLRNPSEVEQNA
jgi:hypothetical protein